LKLLKLGKRKVGPHEHRAADVFGLFWNMFENRAVGLDVRGDRLNLFIFDLGGSRLFADRIFEVR
jgi:hypothetical protein